MKRLSKFERIALHSRGLKFCYGCQTEREQKDFSIDKSQPTGLAKRCRSCTSEQGKSWIICPKCSNERKVKFKTSQCLNCYKKNAEQKRKRVEMEFPLTLLRRAAWSLRKTKNQTIKTLSEQRRTGELEEKLVLECFDVVNEVVEILEKIGIRLTGFHKRLNFKYDAFCKAVSFDNLSITTDKPLLDYIENTAAENPLEIMIENEAIERIIERVMKEKGLSRFDAVELVESFL